MPRVGGGGVLTYEMGMYVPPYQKKWVLLELIELKKYLHSELIKLKKGGLYHGTYPYCFNMGVHPLGNRIPFVLN